MLEYVQMHPNSSHTDQFHPVIRSSVTDENGGHYYSMPSASAHPFNEVTIGANGSMTRTLMSSSFFPQNNENISAGKSVHRTEETNKTKKDFFHTQKDP